ncbi:MAG: hypothetical protein ACTMH4_01715 [Sphingobacterium sp.]
MSKNSIKKGDVNTAIFPFLRLKDDSYLLDLSIDKALEMGIEREDYEDVLRSIEATNDYIKKAKSEPNHEITLMDPENLDESKLLQTMPSGTLTSNGQEQVGTGFFAPYGAMKVRFSCKANAAPVPIYTCRTRALGDWKSKTETGSLFTWTDIDVNLDASNYNVSITFQTTDSNGGVCNWKAMT